MAKKTEITKQDLRDRFQNSDPSVFIPSIDKSIPERPGLDPFDDDLLVSLSDSRENRRARQVFEWETTRRNVAATTL